MSLPPRLNTSVRLSWNWLRPFQRYSCPRNPNNTDAPAVASDRQELQANQQCLSHGALSYQTQNNKSTNHSRSSSPSTGGSGRPRTAHHFGTRNKLVGTTPMEDSPAWRQPCSEEPGSSKSRVPQATRCSRETKRRTVQLEDTQTELASKPASPYCPINTALSAPATQTTKRRGGHCSK